MQENINRTHYNISNYNNRYTTTNGQWSCIAVNVTISHSYEASLAI